MTPTDHALALAARGFYVFPLSPRSKRPPEGVSWARRATRDPERIRNLFGAEDNIGIATGVFGDNQALLVVDVDDKHGKTGSQSLLQLELEGHELPTTLEARTPTGGRHLFYVVAEAVKQGVDVLGPGLDTRSNGGYVVGVGTVLDDREDQVAGEYTFTEPTRPLAPAPDWLVQRCGRPRERVEDADKPLPGVDASRATQRAIEYLRNDAPEAIEGAGGDATTYRVAARVKDFGVSRDECVALMAEHWFEGCGWTDEDLATKVRNAYAYGLDRPGADAPEAIFNGVPVAAPDARYRLASVAEVIGRPPPPWLVRGILPATGLAVVYGAPSSGKTFLVLDVACSIARGIAWASHRVRQGRAVYVGLEGHVGTRLNAYVRGHSIEAADLAGLTVIERQPLDLLNTEHPAALVRDVKAALPGPPAVVVIDTLNRSMPGGDENASEVMGRAIFAASFLSRELDCLVLFVHHSGKNEAAGARGHSSLLGAADSELAVSRNEEGHRIVEVSKVKDGEDGLRFLFDLRSVDLGAVRDHDPDAAPDERITSCVVDGLHAIEPKSGTSVPKLGTHAALGLRALRDAAKAVDLDPDVPFEDDGVLLGQWQAQFEALYADDPTWRKKFFTARAELLRKKVIAVEGDRASITELGRTL